MIPEHRANGLSDVYGDPAARTPRRTRLHSSRSSSPQRHQWRDELQLMRRNFCALCKSSTPLCVSTSGARRTTCLRARCKLEHIARTTTQPKKQATAADIDLSNVGCFVRPKSNFVAVVRSGGRGGRPGHAAPLPMHPPSRMAWPSLLGRRRFSLVPTRQAKDTTRLQDSLRGDAPTSFFRRVCELPRPPALERRLLSLPALSQLRPFEVASLHRSVYVDFLHSAVFNSPSPE